MVPSGQPGDPSAKLAVTHLLSSTCLTACEDSVFCWEPLRVELPHYSSTIRAHDVEKMWHFSLILRIFKLLMRLLLKLISSWWISPAQCAGFYFSNFSKWAKISLQYSRSRKLWLKHSTLIMLPDSLCQKGFAREPRSWDSVAYLSSLALNDLH